MNKFRVTCLFDSVDGGEKRRVFATRKKFSTREAAETYAATVAPSREPQIGHCQFATEYVCGHWCVHDPEKYDGPPDKYDCSDSGSDTSTLAGDRFDELRAVFEFCELFDRCRQSIGGVPCGGRQTVQDEAGSGYLRCDGCGML